MKIITLFSLATQYITLQGFAPFYNTVSFTSLNETRKESYTKKIKNCRPFWFAKYWEFYVLIAYKQVHVTYM